MQTTLAAQRPNTDPRMATAHWLYEGMDNGKYLIHKTTRAGCTTATVAESMNRNEPFLVVVPTNDIADKTVIADSVKYSDAKGKKIIRIPSNHACVINEELCERYPDLKQLPILPLADKCTECEHYECCPVTAIVREENIDGIAITYQKLAALMIAMSGRPNTTAEGVIEKISQVKNFVFDEIHEMQYGKSISITVYDNSKNDKQFDISRYMGIVEKYPYLRNVIANFAMFREENETAQAIFIMHNNASTEDYYKHKLSKTLKNIYTDLGDKDTVKATMAVYSELIDLTKNRLEYNLHMSDILTLYKILCIITNERVVVHGIRDRGHVKVNLVSVDQMYTNMLKSYMMSIQNNPARIMMTSATICSHDYESYFMPGVNIQNKIFGNGGDPMNTNAKMLILADSKQYRMTSRTSLYNMKDEILQRIVTILDRYGDDNCIIVTMSINEAAKLRKDLDAFKHPHEVTYYKSPSMMGVSSDCRIMIAVGAAEKPSNAFDAICESKEQSLILKDEAVHCDTWQAWSRVKDPAGKTPSLVFGLGCSYNDCQNIVKWGYNRRITLEPYERMVGYKTNVSCSDNITKPIVKKCKDFNNMLTAAEMHKHCKNLFTSNDAKCSINIRIEHFTQNEVKINLQSKLLSLFVSRDDVYAEQGINGSYFKVSGMISEKLLENHIAGKITIGVYTLNTKNQVRWMCFDVDAHPKEGDSDEDILQKQQKSEQEKNALCEFFDSVKIPYLLEASGTPYSYHVWVFLKPVEAIKAREFGKDVLKHLNIKNMEVFPKQTKITKNGYGNLVKLPLATHRKTGNLSTLFINGEWVREFDEITVGAIDISSYEIESETKQYREVKPVEGIRPIFKWALDQELTGTEGHAMRIAVVREHYNNGITDPTELAALFRNQPDYDEEISIKQVQSIIGSEYGVWSWNTLIDRCGGFVQKFTTSDHIK